MKSKLFFKIILTAFCIVFIENVNAQTPYWLWTKSIGGKKSDAARSIVVDPGNGDVFATGSFTGTVDFDPGESTFNLSSTGSSSIYIAKIDGSGNFVWAKRLGGKDVAYVLSIALDPSGIGNIYITGSFQGTVDFDPGPDTFDLISAGTSDIFIAHLDGSGNFLWAKAMGGPDAVYVSSIAIDQAGSGEVYIAGYFRGTVDFDPSPLSFPLTSVGNDDVFIAKLDGAGNFAWTKSFGGTGSDVSRCMALDPAGNGGVYTTGMFSGTVDFDPGLNSSNITSVGNFDIFISKLDDSGNFVWAKQLGGAGDKNGSGTSITIEPTNGNIYATGYFEGTADFDPGKGIVELTSSGRRDIFISKLDRRGNLLWAKAIGGTKLDAGGSIAVDPTGTGDVYTTGYFHGIVDFDPGPGSFHLASVGPDDIFISKLDDSGNFEWVKTISGTKEEAANTIALDALGHVYVGGFFNGPTISFDSCILINAESSLGTADIFIAKLDLLTASFNNVDHKSQTLDVYPNPVKDRLIIKLAEEELHDVKITLYDSKGEVVFRRVVDTGSNEYNIDFSGLPASTYIVEVDVNGNKMVEQIVKAEE